MFSFTGRLSFCGRVKRCIIRKGEEGREKKGGERGKGGKGRREGGGGQKTGRRGGGRIGRRGREQGKRQEGGVLLKVKYMTCLRWLTDN